MPLAATACMRSFLPVAPVSVRGFTLIEMAVVLVVVSLVLGSLLVPLASQVEQRKIAGTEQTLEQARDAVLAFAAARGRLPCPAGISGGQEMPSNPSDGVCTTYSGFLPAATLGLSPLDAEGYAQDGWGIEKISRIRYAVRDALVGTQDHVFTKQNGIKLAKMSEFNNKKFFLVCNSGTGVSASDCGPAFKLTEEAVAVIWSVGPNSATSGGLSPDEQENPNPNPLSSDPTPGVFVSRPRGAGAGPEFDDQMVWITPPLLFQRMIAAGQLP